MASTTPTTQDGDPYTDRRVYPRTPVALPASLTADGKRHAVQLLDVSAGGAKLNCPARLVVGATIMLDCGSLARSAVVRWQNGELLGVCFSTELNERDVAALTDRSKALAAWRKARD